MSANPQEIDLKFSIPKERQQPKPAPSGTLPHRSKDREIESIKRTLYNAIDKLEKLTSK